MWITTLLRVPETVNTGNSRNGEEKTDPHENKIVKRFSVSALFLFEPAGIVSLLPTRHFGIDERGELEPNQELVAFSKIAPGPHPRLPVVRVIRRDLLSVISEQRGRGIDRLRQIDGDGGLFNRTGAGDIARYRGPPSIYTSRLPFHKPAARP